MILGRDTRNWKVTTIYVYKEVELINAADGDRTRVTVFYDEKPGIQALKNIAADLLPVPNRHPCLRACS